MIIAMEEKFLIEMVGKLSALDTKVDGINRRLDISNGRIAKVEGKVETLNRVDVDTLVKVDNLAKDEHRRDSSRRTLKSWFVNNLSTIVSALIISWLVYLLNLK